MSKEYIYNSLVQMFQNNNHQKAFLVCAADVGSHNCFENYVSLPITVGITPAYMYIDSVKISDITVNKGSRSINMMLNYNVTYNGQTPDCAPDKTLMFVKNADNIVMEDKGYRCKMTTIGTTTIKTPFLVDFIDLDYGFIGGYYSIGLFRSRLRRRFGLHDDPHGQNRLSAAADAQSAGSEAQVNPGQEQAEAYIDGKDTAPAARTDGVEVFPINYKETNASTIIFKTGLLTAGSFLLHALQKPRSLLGAECKGVVRHRSTPTSVVKP